MIQWSEPQQTYGGYSPNGRYKFLIEGSGQHWEMSYYETRVGWGYEGDLQPWVRCASLAEAQAKAEEIAQKDVQVVPR